MPIDVASLRILTYPAPELRSVAERVPAVDDEVRAVIDRMVELTSQAKGIGLAAPQLGVAWRVFVTVGPDEEPERVYVNPRITDFARDLSLREEGCLSLPGINVEIRRPTACPITALDRDGKKFTLRRDDLLGRVWQHEYDHLDGVLIIDKMTTMDRLSSRKLIKELEAASIRWAES